MKSSAPDTSASPRVSITVYEGTKNPTGKRYEGHTPDDLIAGFLGHPQDRGADKEASLAWSPATFTSDYRKADNLESAWAIGFDVDVMPVPTLEAITDACGAWRGFVHASWSHRITTEKNPEGSERWRLVLVLSRGVNAAEYRRVWDHVRGALPFQVGNANDASRLWFAPGKSADGQFHFAELKGAPVNVDAILAAVPASTGPELARVPATNAPACSVPLEARIAYAREWMREQPIAKSGTNGEGERLTISLFGQAARCHMLTTREALLEAVSDWNARCEPPWEGTELEHKLSEAINRSPIPWASGEVGIRHAFARLRGLALANGGSVSSSANDSTLEGLRARAGDVDGSGGLADLTRCSDTGNAEIFVRLHGDRVRYVTAWKTWLVWDGARWQRDELNKVQELAKSVAARRWDEVKAMGNPEEGESQSKRARWALATESRKGRENLIALAATEPGIPVTHEALDADPWLLNVTNGTVDLRTGSLRDHARGDHLTKLVPVAFDAVATCPTWERFLERVTGGNAGLVAFLARAVGYSLTGDVGEQVLFFLQGAGANGKSTFTKILHELLGDYAKQAAPDLLLAKHGEAHPTEIADLHGARFALCQEVEQGRAWAEATLKQLTGGDRVKARRMREDFWEFEPTHKLWVCANHRPRVRGDDEGIWRRIKLVPFGVTIPEAERDRNLLEKLRAELPGILAWAVRGCVAWQKEGLGVPEEIREATAAYRLAEDQIASFIEEACETGPGYEAPRGAFYEAFRRWLQQSGEPVMTSKEFHGRMVAKNFVEKNKKNARVWQGLRVSDSASRGFAGLATG